VQDLDLGDKFLTHSLANVEMTSVQRMKIFMFGVDVSNIQRKGEPLGDEPLVSFVDIFPHVPCYIVYTIGTPSMNMMHQGGFTILNPMVEGLLNIEKKYKKKLKMFLG
jgi:hypothetical protein